jgi:hypothetical protein
MHEGDTSSVTRRRIQIANTTRFAWSAGAKMSGLPPREGITRKLHSKSEWWEISPLHSPLLRSANKLMRYQISGSDCLIECRQDNAMSLG